MSFMIDWVTCCVPVRHPNLLSGSYFYADRQGEIVREGLTSTTVQGSYSSSIQVKTNSISPCGTYGTEIYISGNPSKFLQGHNVCGIDDITTLVLLTVERVLSFFDVCLDNDSKLAILNGDYPIYRLDINCCYQLNSHSDVVSWLRAAAVQSKTRHGMPALVKNTLYWGKGSTLWLLKAYSKFTELTAGGKKHSLPRELYNSPLLEFSRDKLRIELQLRKELTKIAKVSFNTEKFLARYLNPKFIADLFTNYLSRIDMASDFGAVMHDDLKLPQNVRSTFLCWKRKDNLSIIVPRATYYRHRKIIKDILGVDISIPSSVDSTSNVVALLRPLEARPVEFPVYLQKYMVG